MKAVVFNLGCKTNRYETDAMSAEFRAAGIEVSSELTKADVYVLNTCAVTAEAEKKSRQAVARIRAKNPDAKIYVCGCASEKSPERFFKDGVKLIIGTAAKQKFVGEIFFDLEKTENEIACKEKDFSELSLKENKLREIPIEYEEFSNPPIVNRTRAELKIQDGCNNFCSYCIIPYLRGRSRSRSLSSVVQEAEYLDGKTREIVLTGINLSAYGKEIGTNLAELVQRLRHIDARIRLGSFYVEGVTDELLQALRGLKNFCPHFHLSLQSGDDQVLRAMNRRYSTADYRKAVDKIRDYFPNAGITTDVITCYPTETEEMAKNTLAFLKDVHFSDIHVFVFSKREGTQAAKLRELPHEIKERRKSELLKLKTELQTAFALKNLGVPQSVLVEETFDGISVGYSENYIRVYTENAEPLQTVVPKILYKDGIK